MTKGINIKGDLLQDLLFLGPAGLATLCAMEEDIILLDGRDEDSLLIWGELFFPPVPLRLHICHRLAKVPCFREGKKQDVLLRRTGVWLGVFMRSA